MFVGNLKELTISPSFEQKSGSMPLAAMLQQRESLLFFLTGKKISSVKGNSYHEHASPPLYLNSLNFLSHTCDFICHSVSWMVNLTCITAPALPYGTDAVVYTALFSFSKSLNTVVDKKGEIVQ